MPGVLPAAYPQLTSAHPLAPSYSTYNNPSIRNIVEGGSVGAKTNTHCRSSETSSGDTRKWSSPLRFGLSTPPEDMAGVAVKQSVPSLPPSSYGTTTPYRIQTSYSNAAPERPSIQIVTRRDMASSAVSSRIQQPPSQTSQLPETREKENSGSSIAPYLQIPSSINHSRGSLAEFTAQITCLFWFEKASKLNVVLNSSSSKYHIPPLMPESIPTIGFRKWVTTILSTTQVSQNVVLLALLFIYRLKKFNPAVRGKRGSEFRLMTIALMMGNKFLDDNTYTNKTWAEVSGISVQEIHIMEVEFLSNVRYNLFVTKSEWEQWHTKLGTFADYFTKAARLPLDNEAQPTTPTTQPSPHLTPTTPTSATHLPGRPPKLPSPPGLTSYVPPHHPKYTPAPPPILGHPSLSPRQSSWTVKSNSGLHRKRSWEGPVEEHPSKKMAISTVSGPASLPTLPPVTAVTGGHIPPLTMPSVPQLAIPTLPSSLPQLPRLNFALAQQHYPPFAPQSQPPPILPPSTRAMATVYPPVSTWSQRTPPTTTLAPIPHTLPSTSTNYPDQPKHQSQYTSTSATISPALSAYSVHTPTRLSPSFVIDRNSPYRPVRQVNTLLYPPPSASMNHARHLPLDQMHYQPLGKSVTERKTGVLPYSQNNSCNETWFDSQSHFQSSCPQNHHHPRQQHQQELQQLYQGQSFR
ncbi:mucin [Blastomyces dermatitidis ER-3]|uniref:Mucin n=1 Tax=Ajellomyces dermatitidis (strain ER-3 / ATCC MYA-2586) TaxID=559297 RepID=A0ABP2F5K0_AJEDR|nr:mucin [Blastomyces dermatitidis ER-3]EEQ90709.2 mucin [Blastomyces dermatitidis ER-3]